MSDSPDTTAEAAVRNFLEFVADPSAARDEALIATLREKVATASDPIRKLQLLVELYEAEKADGQALRNAFIVHGRRWADGQGVPVRAFRELGVNDIVLAEAGFDLGLGSTRRKKSPGASRGQSAATSKRQRAKGVSAADIRDWVLRQEEPFTLAQVMADAGGSLGTISKVVDELVDKGDLKRLGTVPAHSGRGRAPYRYGRS